MVASVFNRRLFPFWPQLIEKSDPPTKVSTPTAGQSDTSIPQPDSFWELRLFWSELNQEGQMEAQGAVRPTEAFETMVNALALAENRRGLYRIFDLKREYARSQMVLS